MLTRNLRRVQEVASIGLTRDLRRLLLASAGAIINTEVIPRIIVDTNVLVGAMISARGSNRSVLRNCFEGTAQPVLGEALFLEYEDVLGRSLLMARSPLNAAERKGLFEAFLSVCDWVDVYFGWRPNLPDEDDNHLIELAVAGAVGWLVTNNIADFKRAELRFPQIRVVRPAEFLKEAIR